MIRLALIGCGNWGRNYLKSAASVEGVEISVICDPHLRGEDSDIGAFRDYTDIDGVDGVIVATPPETHRSIACFFIEKRIPTLVEKPVTLNSPDADNLFEASLIRETPVLVNNTHLFSPAFEALKKDVEKWDGPLVINSIGGNKGPFRDYSALFDWGPHDLSMCLSLLNGYPDDIKITKEAPQQGEVYVIELSQGKHRATLTVGNGLLTKKRWFEVTCDDHRAVYDDLVESKLALDGMVCPVDTTPPLVRVLSAFAECIETGTVDWRFDHYLNQNVMDILDKCRIHLLIKHPDLHDKLNFGLPTLHAGE